MIDILVGLIAFFIIGAAVVYIRKEKKRSAACIGCPLGSICEKKQNGSCHTR